MTREKSWQLTRRALVSGLGVGGIGFGGYLLFLRPNPELLNVAQTGNDRYAVSVTNNGPSGAVAVTLLFYDSKTGILHSNTRTIRLDGGEVRELTFNESAPAGTKKYGAEVRGNDILGTLFGV